jgi:A/G-specific adenine glycosylase
MVSEFMLQQTPVSRVLPVYNQWISMWPTPSALASAPQSEVLRAWGRLGYPRRALRLHAAAIVIDRDFDDVVPQTYEQLRSLPGVGDYTAAAILAFAFRQRSVVIDTNIRRVLARAVLGKQWPEVSLSVAERKLAESLVPKSDAKAAKWSAAIMELGATICTASSPQCDACPITQKCEWLARGLPQSQRPYRTQTWHGTDRQCRGKILQALRESDAAVSEETLRRLTEDRDQFERCLTALEQEEFIRKVKQGWVLK